MAVETQIVLPVTQTNNLVFQIFDDGIGRVFMRPQKLEDGYFDYVLSKELMQRLAFQLFVEYYEFLRVDREDRVCYFVRHEGLIPEVSNNPEPTNK